MTVVRENRSAAWKYIPAFCVLERLLPKVWRLQPSYVADASRGADGHVAEGSRGKSANEHPREENTNATR